jgi:aminoglycoside 6'-N-acetyltransferase
MERVEMTFRRLTEADFPLLRGWLAQPHVARWWNHDHSEAGVARDFGPAARGEEPSEDLLVLLGGEPLGLVQRSRLDDYPSYRDELRAVTDVPDGALTVDYFIGEPTRVGRGLGTALIAAIAARTWTDHPTAPAIVVAVVASNPASWRALEKAGFRRVGSGPMEPDNPVDDPLHHVYRMDRPRAH